MRSESTTKKSSVIPKHLLESTEGSLKLKICSSKVKELVFEENYLCVFFLLSSDSVYIKMTNNRCSLAWRDTPRGFHA